MSPKPASFRVTYPDGHGETVLSMDAATQRRAQDERLTVQMIVYADLVAAIHKAEAAAEARVRAECAAELAEADALILAMASQIALLRQRAP